MDRRMLLQQTLQEIMREILPNPVSRSESDNVYFQPDSNVKMKYPAIVYKRDNQRQEHANNLQYRNTLRYLVQIIDRSPDSPIIPRVSRLPMTAFSSHYKVDGLNHDNYVIYF